MHVARVESAEEVGRRLAEGAYAVDVAPGENVRPLSLYVDAHGEELAYPIIYLGVPRRITAARVTAFATSSSEIRRTDRRGVTPEHVLYMAVKVLCFNVRERTMTFRTNSFTDSITREQLEKGGQQFLDDVLNRDMGFLRGIPNTIQYWQERRRELFAMIRQLAKPHVFLTLSASEVHWDRLLETLERLRVGHEGRARVVEEMRSWERVELVNEDPVACAIYTDRIFDVILNPLRDRRCSPFRRYVVRDYFKRVEFQQRGSAHVHTILWLENAPADEELSGVDGAMPKTLEMVKTLLTLDTDLRGARAPRATRTLTRAISAGGPSAVSALRSCRATRRASWFRSHR
ncbi:uncharacterized protein LOC144158176 [Haemaphysalis longicornis]